MINYSNEFKYRIYYRYLEKRGEDALKKLEAALKKEPWGSTLFGLLWSAVPVTFLALNLGYYFAYKRFPDYLLFFYFATYILITGVVSIFVRIFLFMTRDSLLEEFQNDYQYLMNQLPTLLSSNLNLFLWYLDSEISVKKESQLLLQNPDASTLAIELAVEELTKSKILSHAIKIIDIFRRNGIMSRVRYEYRQVRPHLKQALKHLKYEEPELYVLLYNRFRGKIPSREAGIKRHPGFLRRIAVADKTSDFFPMSLLDAFEMLHLTFELLCGRQIVSYYGRFSKGKLLNRKSNQLYQANSEYETIFDQLEGYIYEIIQQLKAIQWPFKLNLFFERSVENNFLKIYDALQWVLNALPEESDALNQMVQIALIYEKILITIHMINQKEIQVNQLKKEFLQAIDVYANKKQIPFAKKKEKGFYLEEVKIQLSMEEKQKVSHFIVRNLKIYSKIFESPEHYPYKELAYRCYHLLNQIIEFDRLENRYCIGKSPSANLVSIEQGTSLKGIVGWADQLIESIDRHSPPSVKENIQWFVNLNRSVLTTADLAILEDQFGDKVEGLDAVTVSPVQFKFKLNPFKKTKMHVYEEQLKLLFHNIQRLRTAN